MARALRVAFAAILLVLSLGAPVAAGLLEDAQAAYAKYDYKTALRLFRPLADQGDAAAQYYVGKIYSINRVGLDAWTADANAVTWFRLAAEQEYAPAQLELAVRYAEGRGADCPREC
jgi:TPR repeat protein